MLISIKVKEKIKIWTSKKSTVKAHWDKQVAQVMKQPGFKTAREILNIKFHQSSIYKKAPTKDEP